MWRDIQQSRHCNFSTKRGCKRIKFTKIGQHLAKMWTKKNVRWHVCLWSCTLQTNGESEMATKFNSQRSSYESMFVGSRPPSDGRWETWMNLTGRSPYPIRYSLRPLVELLDTVYFADADESKMRGKRARSARHRPAFLLLI